jgi:hypothetical protein
MGLDFIVGTLLFILNLPFGAWNLHIFHCSINYFSGGKLPGFMMELWASCAQCGQHYRFYRMDSVLCFIEDD